MHWVFQYDGFGACNVLVPREKVMRSIFAYNLDLWCNGITFNTSLKGSVLDSHGVHLKILTFLMLLRFISCALYAYP